MRATWKTPNTACGWKHTGCSAAEQKYSISTWELEMPTPESFSPSCSGSTMIDWYRSSDWGGWLFESYWGKISLMTIENWLVGITIDTFFRRIKVLSLQILRTGSMLLSESREFSSGNNSKNSEGKEDKDITLYIWHSLHLLYVLFVCLFHNKSWNAYVAYFKHLKDVTALI